MLCDQILYILVYDIRKTSTRFMGENIATELCGAYNTLCLKKKIKI